MAIPEALLKDRNFWKRAANHVRTRAGVLPGEAVFDPAPGPGLLAVELARTMPRFRFFVAGPLPPSAPPNIATAGASPLNARLPDRGLALVTAALTLDEWPPKELKRLLTKLEPEIVQSGRVVLLTRLPSPKVPELRTSLIDAVQEGLLESVGFERVQVEELEYLPDGTQLGVVHCRRPTREEDDKG
ncbi:MAG: hypothetical protein ACRDHY_08885 [Anaerolineales bacterium]